LFITFNTKTSQTKLRDKFIIYHGTEFRKPTQEGASVMVTNITINTDIRRSQCNFNRCTEMASDKVSHYPEIYDKTTFRNNTLHRNCLQ